MLPDNGFRRARRNRKSWPKTTRRQGAAFAHRIEWKHEDSRKHNPHGAHMGIMFAFGLVMIKICRR
jgi:hypothetical protein